MTNISEKLFNNCSSAINRAATVINGAATILITECCHCFCTFSSMKPTLVIGASTNPERYAYKAIRMLREHGHEVIAYGVKPGQVEDVIFETDWNPDWKVDTVTLYLNPLRQEAFYDQIIALKPNRVIFNPGTENPEFEQLLSDNGIFPEEACTLVLLSIGEY